jgi:hypothetical protein
MSVRVFACARDEVEALKKLLEYDPALDKGLSVEALRKLQEDKYGSVIFARKEFSLREGRSFGIDDDNFYLYLKADDDFLKAAEERFSHEFKTVKHADPGVEQKLTAFISEEENKANQGFGAIFGG